MKPKIQAYVPWEFFDKIIKKVILKRFNLKNSCNFAGIILEKHLNQ